MTTTCWRPPIPAAARLGFDRGWLFLQPTFLNFGLPAVLIDRRLISNPDLGLEPLAQRDPFTPWCEANARLRDCNGVLGLWQRRPEELVAVNPQPAAATSGASHDRIILLVGDTYEIGLSWSALWACRAGVCDVERRFPQRLESYDAGPRSLESDPRSSA